MTASDRSMSNMVASEPRTARLTPFRDPADLRNQTNVGDPVRRQEARAVSRPLRPRLGQMPSPQLIIFASGRKRRKGTRAQRQAMWAFASLLRRGRELAKLWGAS